MAIETTRWDTVDYLNSPKAILAYIEAVLRTAIRSSLRLRSMMSRAPRASRTTR